MNIRIKFKNDKSLFYTIWYDDVVNYTIDDTNIIITRWSFANQKHLTISYPKENIKKIKIWD